MEENDSNSPKSTVPEIELEEASSLPMPDTMFKDPLFSADSFALATGKYVALDSMLKLLTRDYRFTEFARELLLIIMNVVKSEAGSLLEVNHNEKVLFFRASVGQSSDSIGNFTVPIGQGIAGFVAESLQPLVVADVKENRMHLKAIEKAVGFETRNLVALPVIVRGRIFGVLEVLNRVGEDDYTPADIELLTYLTEAAARAIEIRLMITWAKTSLSAKKGEAA
ncbi:MAG: GAF domain-containing protein [Oligoflexia bacterium]|nr:GAF domain-containing protein [Oligoflexia bacterium]